MNGQMFHFMTEGSPHDIEDGVQVKTINVPNVALRDVEVILLETRK